MYIYIDTQKFVCSKCSQPVLLTTGLGQIFPDSLGIPFSIHGCHEICCP